MAIGRPIPPLTLDDGERETLEQWVRRPKTAQALALRAANIPFARLPNPAHSQIYWNQALTSLSLAAHPSSDQHGYIPSVDSGSGARASGVTAVSMVACRAALPLIGEPLCPR